MEVIESKSDSESLYMNLEDMEKNSNQSEIYDNVCMSTTTEIPGSAGACERIKVNVSNIAAVGLGFLCVLLLAVIIVLCIKHNKDMHRIQNLNDNITIESNMSQSSYKFMATEKDTLQSRYNIMATERDTLQSRYDIMATERDTLQSRYNIMATERDTLQSRYNIMATERDTLQSRYDIMATERDTLQSRYNIMATEKEQLLNLNNKLISERAQLEHIYNGEIGSCPNGWTRFLSSCYFISSTKSWEGSRLDCRSTGADLVIINSKEEQQFVSGLGKNLWIGLTDHEQEGQWKWVDNTPLESGYWMDNEPNNAVYFGEDEDCAEVQPKLALVMPNWNDNKCSRSLSGLCEKKIRCSTQ